MDTQTKQYKDAYSSVIYIYRVFLNHWSIIDLYCGRNFDHIVSRFFAMCSHGSGYFSDMSHMIIGQIYFFVERQT